MALDTEYHDPEEFLSLSPPVDMSHISVSQANSSIGGSSRFFPTPEQDAETFNYVNHNVIKRAPSDPVPECPDDVPAEPPPPIPTKKGKVQAMGGQMVMPGVGSGAGKGGTSATPVVVPLPSSGKAIQGQAVAGFTMDEVDEYTDADEVNIQLLALNGGAKQVLPQFPTSSPALSSPSPTALQPPARVMRTDGAASATASSSPHPPIAIKPKVLVNVGGNPPLPSHKPAVPRKPESPPIRTSPLVWQTRMDGNDFFSSSSSPHSSSSASPTLNAMHKSKVVPSAPPLPPEEVSVFATNYYFLVSLDP